MTTKAKCKQTVIPTVDNTNSGCEECGYIDFKCVTASKALVYLGITAGMSLEQALDKFLADYKKKVAKITTLEAEMTALKLRVTALETP